MALIDAYKYVQENIDENFPVQNITKNHRCKTIMKEISKSIAYFGNERECKIFYEYHNGITVFCDYSVQFEKLQDLKSEQEIIDKEIYKADYKEITTYFQNQPLEYEKAISVLKTILDSGVF